MSDIQINPAVSDQLAPLYKEYPGDSTPCQALMVLRPSGHVQFMCNIQRGYTSDVYYGRERTWEIPPELTFDDLMKLGERLKDLLSQVHRGLCISWDEQVYEERGTLTPEAQKASDEIQNECEHLFDAVKWQDIGVYIVEPSDYFDGESPEDYGLDAHSSDEDLRREAAELSEHFKFNNMMMYGDMFDMVKDWVRNYEHY